MSGLDKKKRRLMENLCKERLSGKVSSEMRFCVKVGEERLARGWMRRG